MILPFMLGLLTGRYVEKRLIVGFLGLLIGLGLGLVAGLEIVPLLYPFMVVQIPWVGVPEIRRVGISLTTPDFVLLEESVHFLSYSLTFLTILIVISILGAVIGVNIGRRYHPGVIDSPWKETDQEQ